VRFDGRFATGSFSTCISITSFSSVCSFFVFSLRNIASFWIVVSDHRFM
jgi:predicted AlkP superfamily pyrophosphatase or phosphodiesterase